MSTPLDVNGSTTAQDMAEVLATPERNNTMQTSTPPDVNGPLTAPQGTAEVFAAPQSIDTTFTQDMDSSPSTPELQESENSILPRVVEAVTSPVSQGETEGGGDNHETLTKPDTNAIPVKSTKTNVMSDGQEMSTKQEKNETQTKPGQKIGEPLSTHDETEALIKPENNNILKEPGVFDIAANKEQDILLSKPAKNELPNTDTEDDNKRDGDNDDNIGNGDNGVHADGNDTNNDDDENKYDDDDDDEGIGEDCGGAEGGRGGQAKKGRCHINRTLLPLKLFNFFYYGAAGSVLPFLSVYLQHLRLTAPEAGVITGGAVLVAALLRPALGLLADVFRARRLLLAICCLLFGSAVCCLWFVPRRVSSPAEASVGLVLHCTITNTYHNSTNSSSLCSQLPSLTTTTNNNNTNANNNNNTPSLPSLCLFHPHPLQARFLLVQQLARSSTGPRDYNGTMANDTLDAPMDYSLGLDYLPAFRAEVVQHETGRILLMVDGDVPKSLTQEGNAAESLNLTCVIERTWGDQTDSSGGGGGSQETYLQDTEPLRAAPRIQGDLHWVERSGPVSLTLFLSPFPDTVPSAENNSVSFEEASLPDTTFVEETTTSLEVTTTPVPNTTVDIQYILVHYKSKIMAIPGAPVFVPGLVMVPRKQVKVPGGSKYVPATHVPVSLQHETSSRQPASPETTSESSSDSPTTTATDFLETSPSLPEEESSDSFSSSEIKTRCDYSCIRFSGGGGEHLLSRTPGSGYLLDGAFLLSLVLICITRAFFSAEGSLLDAVTYSFLGRDRHRWGRQRLWGTVGTGTVALVFVILGDTVTAGTFSPLFISCGTLTVIATATAALFLKTPPSSETTDTITASNSKSKPASKNDSSSTTTGTKALPSIATTTTTPAPKDDRSTTTTTTNTTTTIPNTTNTTTTNNTTTTTTNTTTTTTTGSKALSHIAASLRSLLREGAVWVFLVKILTLGMLCGSAQTFTFWYLRELGAGQSLLWACLLTYCVSTICVLHVSPLVVRWLGERRTIYLALPTYCLRFVAESLIHEPWLAVPIGLTHGVTYALLWAAVSASTHLLAPPATRTTCQAIAGAIYWDVGRGLGNVLTGQLFSLLGSRWTLRAYGVTAAILLPVWLVLDRYWPLPAERGSRDDTGPEDKDVREPLQPATSQSGPSNNNRGPI